MVFNPFPADKNVFIPRIHWIKFLKISCPHWIQNPICYLSTLNSFYYHDLTDSNRGNMQQLITFLLFKIKKTGQQQTCSEIKDLQEYIKIYFYTYRGYQDIDLITKIFQKMLKNFEKKLWINILFT